MRQIKKKTLGLVLLARIIAFGCIIQSCHKEDNILTLHENSNYSDYLNVDVHNHTTAFNTKEIEIVVEAFRRIDKYLAEKNDIAYISDNKREVRIKLNISENLFEYLLLGVNNSIQNYQIRLRSEVEYHRGIGSSMRSVRLSHAETIALMNGMQTAASHTGFWGGLGAGAAGTLAGIVGSTAATVLVGGRFYLEGLSWANMENNYLQGSQGGAEYIETTVYSPSGMTHTYHQFIYY